MQTVNFDDESARVLKALVYGAPGTGKTNFGVSAPEPLILLSERQAITNIRDAAKRLGRPRPVTLVMETLDDYRAVIKATHGDRSKPFVVYAADGSVALSMATWPSTIVIDSLTDVCEMVSNEIRLQSPQRTGKDGLPVDSERYWNVLSDRAAKFIRGFRDVPLNILFLCLLDDREVGEGDEKTRVVGPRFPMRALKDVVMAAVNVVGVTYRKRSKDVDKATGERPMVYGIATLGPDYMALKPYPPLRSAEVTDFASWCERINGKDDGSKAPEPMEPTTLVSKDEIAAVMPEATTTTTEAVAPEPPADVTPAEEAPDTASTKPKSLGRRSAPATTAS